MNVVSLNLTRNLFLFALYLLTSEFFENNQDWTSIVARRYVKKWRKLTKNGVDQFGL